VDDSGADLGLDVIADDREAPVSEAGGPIRAGADEDGDAVDEAAAGLEALFDLPFGS